MNTDSSIRRKINTYALEIAGALEYLATSGKRSQPPNWRRIVGNLDLLRAAYERAEENDLQAAADILALIRWPATDPAP